MRGTMTAIVQYLVRYMVGVFVLSCMVLGTIGSTNVWGVTASSLSTTSSTTTKQQQRQIQVIGQPAPDVVLVPVAGPPTVGVDVPAPTPVAVGTTPFFGHLPCNLCGANDGELQFGSNVIMMDGTFDFLTSDITCSELYTNAVNAVYSPPNCFLLRISYLPDYCGCPTEDGTIRTSTPVMVSSPVPTESPIVVVEPIVPTTPAPITTAPVVLPLTTAPTTVPPTTMAPTTIAPTATATATATAIIHNYTIPNLYITLYQVNDTMPSTIATEFMNAIEDALIVESSLLSEGESVPPYNTMNLLPTNSSSRIEFVFITWTYQTLLVPSSAGTVPDGNSTTLLRRQQRNLYYVNYRQMMKLCYCIH